ncbi:MAG: carboxypeptidase-like regulatory domain-containing protein [Flammeovirgaceae bacterium]
MIMKPKTQMSIYVTPILSLILFVLSLCLFGQGVKNINGRVVDATTLEPLPFAHIILVQSGVSTISNGEGDFALEISSAEHDTLKVSYIGYASSHVPIVSFALQPEKLIRLVEEPKKLAEVEVTGRKASPVDLIKEAVANIPSNYSAAPLGLESFYREQYKFVPKKVLRDGQPRKAGTGYKITEAVFEGYHPSYNAKDAKKNSLLHLINGRQVNITKEDDPESDSLMSNSMSSMGQKGGPYETLQYDLRQADKLDFLDSFKDYDYRIASFSNYQGKPTIKIEFDQRDDVKRCLFAGHIILEAATAAIIEIEFHYSKKKLDKAFHMKLLGIGFTSLDEYGTIQFRPDADRWVLSYIRKGRLARLDVNRKIKGHKIDASFEVNESFETLITKIKNRKPNPLLKEEVFGKRDLVTKKITNDYDPDFWKGYSVLLLESNEVKK